MVSWQTRTAALLGRLTIRQSLKRGLAVSEMRGRIRAMERFFPAVPDDIDIATTPALSHCDAEWLTPHSRQTERVILHLPGGAFMTRFVRAERLLLARMCKASNAKGRLVFYRLAPENPYPAGLDDSFEAYRQLLDLGISPQHIVLSGMSAGGCLALALLLKIRDLDLPMPACGVLMSPAADMTDASESGSRISNAAADPVLNMERGDDIRQLYLGRELALVNHPYVSPVLGDFHGLPPLFFQVGSTEILLDDSQRCAERARLAGGRAEVEVWDRMPHGWQALPFAPESGRAIARIGDFIRESCP